MTWSGEPAMHVFLTCFLPVASCPTDTSGRLAQDSRPLHLVCRRSAGSRLPTAFAAAQANLLCPSCLCLKPRLQTTIAWCRHQGWARFQLVMTSPDWRFEAEQARTFLWAPARPRAHSAERERAREHTPLGRQILSPFGLESAPVEIGART